MHSRILPTLGKLLTVLFFLTVVSFVEAQQGGAGLHLRFPYEWMRDDPFYQACYDECGISSGVQASIALNNFQNCQLNCRKAVNEQGPFENTDYFLLACDQTCASSWQYELGLVQGQVQRCFYKCNTTRRI